MIMCKKTWTPKYNMLYSSGGDGGEISSDLRAAASNWVKVDEPVRRCPSWACTVRATNRSASRVRGVIPRPLFASRYTTPTQTRVRYNSRPYFIFINIYIFFSSLTFRLRRPRRRVSDFTTRDAHARIDTPHRPPIMSCSNRRTGICRDCTTTITTAAFSGQQPRVSAIVITFYILFVCLYTFNE